MHQFLRVYPSVFALFFLLIGQISSQEVEPALIQAKVLQGETYTYEVISSDARVDRVENQGGSYTFEETSLNFAYNLVFESDPDFSGETRFIIERRSIDQPFDVYTEVVVRVVPSMLEANRDVVVIGPDQTDITIDALSNDIVGNGASSLVGFDLVSDGAVSIVNDKLVFNKATGFEGETSFNYTIEDESGYQSSSVVTVVVGNGEDEAGSTLTYLTSAVSPVDIYLIDPTYALSEESVTPLGTLDDTQNHVIRYIPKMAANGKESFTLVNDNGDEISVIIDIVDDGLSSLSVRDDIYYTSVGHPISFDPRENDLNLNGILIDYSDELVESGGTLTFSPDQGYSGVETFTYTVLEGAKEITGEIEIHVSDYMPQRDEYSFQTTEGEAFLIEYLAPITNFSWSVVTPPSNGILEFNRGSHVYACGVASGNRMTLYDPSAGFVGQDHFVIRYCIDDGGPCKDVAVDMTVLPSGSLCGCRGNDCVWAGDTDNDGRVSVKDILAIGYNYGEVGNARFTQSDEWGANHAVDWAFDQEGAEDLNIKFVDSNGDGSIDSEDQDGLHDHMNQHHNITADEVLAQKSIPLTFVETSKGPYAAGDVVTLDVIVGALDNPVLDLKGLVFSAIFPSDKVNTSSVEFSPNLDWFGKGSTVLNAISNVNGLLEVGLVRTSNVGVFGGDRIGETRLTVNEMIDGLEPGQDSDFVLKFQAAQMKDVVGKSFSLEGQELVLDLVTSEQLSVSESPEIIISPNPTDIGQLNFHANRQDIIHDIEIYDLTGKLITEYHQIDQQSFRVDHQLSQGLYTARITSQRGVSLEKIQVIDAR